MVLKGASPADVSQRLKIFDKLRVERVKTVIEYTREMAPKRTESNVVDHKTTQTYSDYYWRYKMTEDAVQCMKQHGYSTKLLDIATGEIAVS